MPAFCTVFLVVFTSTSLWAFFDVLSVDFVGVFPHGNDFNRFFSGLEFLLLIGLISVCFGRKFICPGVVFSIDPLDLDRSFEAIDECSDGDVEWSQAWAVDVVVAFDLVDDEFGVAVDMDVVGVEFVLVDVVECFDDGGVFCDVVGHVRVFAEVAGLFGDELSVLFNDESVGSVTTGVVWCTSAVEPD